MKIHHTGIYVRDLEGVRQFFIDYLGAQAGSKYHNPRTDFESYFLTFDGDAKLEIMTRPTLAPAAPKNAADAPAPGLHHIAFTLGSRSAVDDLTARLAQSGYQVLSGPRVTGDGYYESSIEVVEGLNIELSE